MAIRYAGQPTFAPQPMVSASGSSGAASAAGVVDVSKAFGALREKAPKFDQLAATDMANRSNERATNIRAEADTVAAGLSQIGATKQSALQAQGAIKAAQAQANAAKQSVAQSAMMGVARTGLKLLTGGLFG